MTQHDDKKLRRSEEEPRDAGGRKNFVEPRLVRHERKLPRVTSARFSEMVRFSF